MVETNPDYWDCECEKDYIPQTKIVALFVAQLMKKALTLG